MVDASASGGTPEGGGGTPPEDDSGPGGFGGVYGAGDCCGGSCPVVDGYTQACMFGVCYIPPLRGTCASDVQCAEGERCVGTYVCCSPDCAGQLGQCVPRVDAGIDDGGATDDAG
ncbi:MAG: hypothetical protein FJ104_06750 [Deltaproteobacteria bacterium]|nr:hypothetical protein [Deltaproteobacteria bacterium]